MYLLKSLGDVRERSGECNLCRVDEKTGGAEVVVDLGYPVDRCASCMPERCSRQAVRAAAAAPTILVLTHSDEDHVGGFECFAEVLDQRGIVKPEEVWVPADWGYLGAAIFAHRYSSYIGQEFDPAWFGDVLGPDHRIDDLVELFDDDPGALHMLEDDIRRNEQRRRYPSARRAADAVATKAEHILGILAKVAEWRGTRLKFFSVDGAASLTNPPWKAVGRREMVTSVNGRRVTIVVRQPSADVVVAALTPQNRRAIATYIWPTVDSGGGAIVWSDTASSSCISRRGTDLTPWEETVVMTAPHHASNDRAHTRIWRARRPPTLSVVLSGNAPDPRQSLFEDMPKNLRACTRCCDSGTRQDVTFSAKGLSTTCRDC